MLKSRKILFALTLSAALSLAPAALAREYAVPSGETVGIKIYADSLTVTGLTEFCDSAGNYVCPARDAGIKCGDVIKSVNGSDISTAEEFSELLDGRTLNIEINREGGASVKTVTPSLSSDGMYHTGAWVRDSTAGIGTMTCFDPSTFRYIALGHAVTDVDTGNIMTVGTGNIQDCRITGVNKGHIGFPGSVSADFGERNLGTIDKNLETGISGTLENAPDNVPAVPVADFSEIRNGSAEILTDVCGDGVIGYSADIKVISETGTRSMVIEITDERLLEMTGGIVQGMSGAPVIQDGRLVGAVTHVFVNDPAKGYCISADKLAD